MQNALLNLHGKYKFCIILCRTTPFINCQSFAPVLSSLQIGLLLGSNCPRAMEPLEVCPAGTSTEGPYAVKLRHGCTVHGPVSSSDGRLVVNRVAVAETKVSEHLALDSLVRNFNKDFQDFSHPC